MDRRGISVTFVALMLAVMMTSSTTATPGMGTMQMSPGSEDGQPDAENNTLYPKRKEAHLTLRWVVSNHLT